MSTAASSRRVHPLLLALLLALALPPLLVLSVRTGIDSALPWERVVQGSLATCGLAAPLPDNLQIIVELRLWRALTAAGVGAALALAGALLQGVFRNALASPSVLGVTGGASLGATLALVVIGAGSRPLVSVDAGPDTLLVAFGALAGALITLVAVLLLAGAGGRISTPGLLLTGIAINACLGGVLALVSSLTLRDWEVSRAILSWSFGTLDDRAPEHALGAWIGLALALGVVPFVAWELDLLQTGEEDARSLGVRTGRVRALCIVGSSVATAAAVAVAGPIAFVGLVAPHIVRLLTGRGYRTLLWLSPLAGAAFLLGIDLGQRALLGAHALPPGVMMSLVGGPFFLALLLWQRRELHTW